MKALVADDDLMTRTILQGILSGFGEIQTCKDGDEAVEAHRTALLGGNGFDLICMDVQMPKMGGIEALTLIREEETRQGEIRPHDMRVIMTTASGDSETIRQAFRGLCDAYVIKPIDAKELIDIMHCLFPIESRP